MTDSTTETKPGPRWLPPALWVLGSFLFFVPLFLDPFSWHPLDEWLRARMGVDSAAPAHQASAPKQEMLFYRNPMDPTVTSPVPKQDEMGMDYLPVYADDSPPAGSVAGAVLFYRSPMDPTITSPVPAKDAMGMEYIPVYAADATAAVGEGSTVRIDPVVVQNMNVQTAEVTRRNLQHDVRTIGSLEYDQERMVTVTTRFSGWVEKVYVNYVGEPVREGQPLFEIYSPELVQTEQELLSARQYAANLKDAPPDSRRRAQALVEAARTRLGYWDVTPEQVAELEQSGRVFRTLQVVAPSSGLIMMRMSGLEGMAVKPGMDVYHIAGLSTLWLAVDVFEDQISWISVGVPAQITFSYFPGESFRGKVRFIEPELQAATRTLRVKIEVPNPGGRLRAGMFATVVFEPVAARQVLAVPSLAVLRTGRRSVVIVDLGDGRFSPRVVRLGHEGKGFAEVLEGVEEGEWVVTSSQFLIDSEASLQEAIQKMILNTARGLTAPGAGGEPVPGALDAGGAVPKESGQEHDGHTPQPPVTAHGEHHDAR